MDLFSTYTCKQKKHFGVKNVKNWFDTGRCEKIYPGFNKLTSFEKTEMGETVNQSATLLLLHIWQ